ncbi:hypothetical protein VTL71DRAFT_7323 [Oculimacula yallundae]|uniref:Uncharacterized protein n=1 Tax=Oculimacula yallundae TaxID=86028 RepID=A0ABR4BWC7_9HELO
MEKGVDAGDLEKGLNSREVDRTDVCATESCQEDVKVSSSNQLQDKIRETEAEIERREGETQALKAKIQALEDEKHVVNLQYLAEVETHTQNFNADQQARELEIQAVELGKQAIQQAEEALNQEFNAKVEAIEAEIREFKEESQARLATEIETITKTSNAERQALEQQAQAAQQALDDLELDRVKRSMEHKLKLQDFHSKQKDVIRNSLVELLIERDNLTGESARTRSAKDLIPYEKRIGSAHLNNMLFLRAKVLKHDRLPGMAAEKSARGEPEVEERLNSLQSLDRLEEIRIDLANYTTAQRDFQYWKDTCRSRKSNPVMDYYEDGEILALIELDSLAKTHWESVVFEYYSTDFNINHTGVATDKVRQAEELSDAVDTEIGRKAFIERFLMALFGGLTLIGPMLIMSLHSTKLTQLLTTSLFVIAVAMALAFLKDLQPKDIIIATVAYAAVLVVFVGAGSGVSS